MKKTFIILTIFFSSACSTRPGDLKRSPSSPQFSKTCSELATSILKPKIYLYGNQTPDTYLKNKMKDYIEEVQLRPSSPPKELSDRQTLKIRAKRNIWTKLMYDKGIIDATPWSRLFLDKLIQYKTFKHYLGSKTSKYFNYTKGLKEFLSENKFVNEAGDIIVSRAELKKGLDKYFPEGFILKPAYDFGSDGKGFYNNQDKILDHLMSSDGVLYSNKEFFNLDVPKDGGVPTSGERFLIQSLITGASGIKTKDTAVVFEEFRVHSLYDKVVTGASLHRWKKVSPGLRKKFVEVETYVQEMLDQLPYEVTHKQAWAFDVIETKTGLIIIEANTNRGVRTNWSGFLKHPKVLGGYIRHLEGTYGWNFQGAGGVLLRNNMGDMKTATKKALKLYWNKFIDWYRTKVLKLKPLPKQHVDTIVSS